jgi:hypothetical protein
VSQPRFERGKYKSEASPLGPACFTGVRVTRRVHTLPAFWRTFKTEKKRRKSAKYEYQKLAYFFKNVFFYLKNCLTQLKRKSVSEKIVATLLSVCHGPRNRKT